MGKRRNDNLPADDSGHPGDLGAFFGRSNIPGVTPGRLMERPEAWRLSRVSSTEFAANQRFLGMVLLLTGIAVAVLTIIKARGPAKLETLDVGIAVCASVIPAIVGLLLLRASKHHQPK